MVIETNVAANIRVHNCPAYGRPRDVAGAIVDRMIETSGRRRPTRRRPHLR
jgi:hypothetical protein